MASNPISFKQSTTKGQSQGTKTPSDSSVSLAGQNNSIIESPSSSSSLAKDPFLLQGKAKWLEKSPFNIIGTCKVSNSNYDDWVGFMSSLWIGDSEDNFSCAPFYCIKIVNEERGVMIKINGRGEVNGMDIQVSKKVLEALGANGADEIEIQWKPYSCDTYPLGPSDSALPNISFS